MKRRGLPGQFLIIIGVLGKQLRDARRHLVGGRTQSGRNDRAMGR